MNSIKKTICLTTLFFFILITCGYCQDSQSGFSLKPVSNNGKKWRVGYYEGGFWYLYTQVLIGVVDDMADLGWLEKLKYPKFKNPDDSKAAWNWIADNAKSDYIEFVKDAYWSSDWSAEMRVRNREEALVRLNQKKSKIDLMLVCGTKGGQDLANNRHSTSTLVICCSNPYAAGIVKGQEYSGFKHVHATTDPTRYERQVKLFHFLTGFKKLGVVFADTVEGRIYAGFDSIQRVAGEKGFEVLSCNAIDDTPDIEVAEKAVFQCIEKLAPQIDAFYLTLQSGITDENLDRILAPLFKHKVPTFSQVGNEHVKRGALFSIAISPIMYTRFYAGTMAHVFNGAEPGQLNQVYYKDSPRIVINLETAKRIGYDPGVNMISVADIIHNKIVGED